MSHVRPQRAVGSPTETHATPEYDGADTPVLIRIPDLNAAARTTKRRTPIGEELASANPDSAAKSRRKRRIHRSHVPQERAKNNPRPAPARSFEPRTKIFAALLLVAILGIGYAFLKGGNAEPEQTDGWATIPEPAPPTITYEPTEDVDLWPVQETVAAQPKPPEQATPISTVWPDSQPASMATEIAPSTPLVSHETTTIPLSGPSQQHSVVTSFPEESPAPPSHHGPIGGWPEQRPESTIPAQPVSHDVTPDGASVATPELEQYATISGLAPRWRGGPHISNSPQTPPSLRKNHERIQQALR